MGRNFEMQMCHEAYQASPKDKPPMHRGETLTEALGDSRRCLPRRDLGCGAGSIASVVVVGKGWSFVQVMVQ